MRLNPVKHEKTLESLIERYAANKAKLDHYTEQCNADKSEIKDIMAEEKLSVKITDRFIARRQVSVRESLNEENLIQVLKRSLTPDRYAGIIRTKEYVDMTALEKFLYSADMPDSFFAELESCKKTSEVISLKVTERVEKE